MKLITPLLSLALLISSSIMTPAYGDHYHDLGYTEGNTLNDLIGKVIHYPLPPQKHLIRLSRIQEELVVFERRMHGDGLSPILAKAFSVNYTAIHNALIDDRITEEYGRDLLSVHRQLLDKTYQWEVRPNRDPEFGKEVIRNLHHFVSELQENSLTRAQVSPSIKTPVINGYQVWLDELMAWACECNGLNAGLVSRLRVQAENLQRFECLYKSDGVLYSNEREHLHKQFLKVTEETFQILRRSY